MKIKVPTSKEIEIREMQISLKVRDEFRCAFVDDKGNEILEYDGYVPSFMPGEHYGDYVTLNIDLETGQILNWNPIKEIQRGLQDFMIENYK